MDLAALESESNRMWLVAAAMIGAHQSAEFILGMPRLMA